jgi:DNA (cytosine-5)-methyltransferase 1
LTGGFPCQDVSVSGKQSLEGGRTILVEYLLQILEQKQPENFVFENVKGLLSKKFKPFYEMIVDRIEKAGYNLEIKVLDTRNF